MSQTPEQKLEASKRFEASFSVKGPRLLIRRDPIKQETQGIIQLIDSTAEKERQSSVRGTVLQVGEQCYNLPSQRTRNGEQVPWCKAGDKVFFGQYAGSKVINEGVDDLIIINDEDVLGVLREA